MRCKLVEPVVVWVEWGGQQACTYTQAHKSRSSGPAVIDADSSWEPAAVSGKGSMAHLPLGTPLRYPTCLKMISLLHISPAADCAFTWQGM